MKNRIRLADAALVLVIICLGFMLYYQLTQPNIQKNIYITQKASPGIQGLQGVQGLQGIQGLRGISGQDGKDGATIIKETQVIQQPIAAQKGDKGDEGKSGNQIIVKVDFTRCVLMSQYQGDDGWQDLAQLPKPCEVSGD